MLSSVSPETLYILWVTREHTLHHRAANVCGMNGRLPNTLVKSDLFHCHAAPGLANSASCKAPMVLSVPSWPSLLVTLPHADCLWA